MKHIVFENALIHMLKSRSEEPLYVIGDWIAVNNRPRVRVLKLQQEDCRLMPMVYPDDYEIRYEQGESIESLADEILKHIAETKRKNGIPEDFFQEYETVRKGLYCRVINAEKNRDLLRDIPHEPHGDLAVVYYYEMQETWMEDATILIRNEHLMLWNRSGCEVRADAWKNTLEGKPVRFKKLSQVLVEFGMPDTEEFEDNPLYLLTNEGGGFGAATAFYPDVLLNCARTLHARLILLPSSIHEWLLLPVKKEEELEYCNIAALRSMVQEINRTQLEEKEVLSDQIYFYDPIEDELSRI